MSDILHITRDFPPRWGGGISTALRGIVDAERRAGHDVEVISFDAWRPARADTYRPPREVPDELHPRTRTQGELKVWRLQSEDSPEIVQRQILEGNHAHIEVHHALLWPLAAESAAARGVPAHYMAHVLSELQDELRALEDASLSAQAERQALEEAAQIITPSRWVTERLQERMPAKRSRIVYRALRLVDEDFPPELSPLHERAWDVIYIARFSDLKGSARALDLLAALHTLRPETRSLIIGGLPESPKTEARVLKRWRERHPNHDLSRITFAGWLPRDEALERLSQSRVFLSTSAIETWGLALAEAVRCECRALVSSIPAHQEQAADNAKIRTLSLSAPDDAWCRALAVLVGSDKR